MSRSTLIRPPLRLRPDETLLWAGAPVPGFHRRRVTFFMMLFGLPFLISGVSLFLYSLLLFPQAATVPDGGNALITTVFSLPFAAFGGFLVLGPIFEARSAARDTRYALTTCAAYVIRQGQFPSLKVYPILPSSALELERGTRASTVWVHSRRERDSEGDLGTTKAGFENIAEGEKVFAMIRDLQGETDA
ncbi:MAG: hypothetical protein U1E06_24795 [Tabrizicola sp.]|uniref:hypothetical protein n=1 Tax=Tabrizicola sp. TaxID=2005166 RepID=UPI0027353A3E|nr:hypothetical protein [Tabrizicola sp.]MDP3263540.1 hypothetical protein [Tabrizicola sp.]MDP3649731.1 hypothetical protein [Paracoccaceae bacterium]MDZ4070023.1 hypothetical protein [Tabrizicola sp.]